MHISCCKAHADITKQTNWTFTWTLIDLDKIYLYYFLSLFCHYNLAVLVLSTNKVQTSIWNKNYRSPVMHSTIKYPQHNGNKQQQNEISTTQWKQAATQRKQDITTKLAKHFCNLEEFLSENYFFTIFFFCDLGYQNLKKLIVLTYNCK